MLRWGIIATGSITKKFADALNGLYGRGSIAAVASRNEGRAREFAAEHGIKKYYGSYEALCQDDDIDVVYIATPNNMHFDNGMLCLENGKHVLLEKPFTTCKRDGEALFQAAAERGLFIMEAFWIKHLPLLKKMEEMITAGVIGEVRHLRADYGFTAAGARKARKFDSALGGGALLDIGVYNLGFARMVMGSAPEGMTSKAIINEYGTDEFSTVTLSYPGGKTAVATTAIGMDMGTPGAVYGSKGAIYFDNYQKAESMEVRVYGQEPYTIRMPFEINGFEYQIREAQRCIAAKMVTSDILTKEDTLDVLEIMDGLRSSWGMKFAFEE